MKFNVIEKEKKNDSRRTRVLLGVKNITEARVEVINHTDESIPSEVLKVLERGLDRAVGGRPDEYGLLTSFEAIYRHWVQYAGKLEISPLSIWKTGNRISVDFDRLTTCFSDDKSCTVVKTHLKQNLTKTSKTTASKVKMNFGKLVAPKKYKISSLTGEIYRAVNCTSTLKDREDALGQINNLYKKNGLGKTL